MKIITLIVLNVTLFFANVFSQSVTVNTTDYKQAIDMMGGDMERSSKFLDNAANPQEIANWCFSDIKFNVCRVQFDKNQELVEGTKNWAFYDDQLLSMQNVKVANPNIKWFAVCRTDYDGYGNENNMPDWIVNYTTKVVNTTKYGIFLADYCEYMNNHGFPIEYIATTKEWISFISATTAKAIIQKLNSECTARSIPKPKIIDQATWQVSNMLTYMTDVTTLNSSNLYYAFSTHNYNNQPDLYDDFVTQANGLGKPAYNDETSAGAGGPTSGAEPDITVPIAAYKEKTQAYAGGLQGEILFELWSRGINTETRSVYFQNGGTGVRLRGYYIMKDFANNTFESVYVTQSVSGMTGVTTMAFRKGLDLFVWVVNESTTGYSSSTINLSSGTISGNVTQKYWTNITAITGATSTLTGSTSFTANIRAQSINFFKVTLNDQTNGAPVGKQIWIKANANGKYWTASPGLTQLFATATTVGNAQLFSVFDAGNGKILLRSNLEQKYVRGNFGLTPAPIETNTGTGGWAQFAWESAGSGNYLLKADNAMYIRTIPSTNAIEASGGTGGWSLFTYGVVGAAKSAPQKESIPVDNSKQVSIWPNPTHGDVTINAPGFENAQLEVINLNGSVVHTLSGLGASNKISLENLKKGIYLIKIHDQVSSEIKKLIIE